MSVEFASSELVILLISTWTVESPRMGRACFIGNALRFLYNTHSHRNQVK